jgi:hypothetical protein
MVTSGSCLERILRHTAFALSPSWRHLYGHSLTMFVRLARSIKVASRMVLAIGQEFVPRRPAKMASGVDETAKNSSLAGNRFVGKHRPRGFIER